MAKFLPEMEHRPSTGEKLGNAIGGLGQSFSNYIVGESQKQQAHQQRSQEDQWAKTNLGIDLSGMQDPKLRQAYVEKALQGQLQQEKFGFQNQLDVNKSQRKENVLGGILGSKNSIEPSVNQSEKNEEKIISSGFDPTTISDEDIIRSENEGIRGLRQAKDAALKKKENLKKEKQTEFQSDREYHSKVSQPIIDAAQQSVRLASTKKALINQQRKDIQTGNVEGIIPFLVERTGLEVFRNPESARFKTASKQRFVESIHELGGSAARPNQFIEQQLVQAQPTLGRSAESNETVLDMEEFVEDMKNERAKLELQLAEEDREKYGFARNDISQRADKMMGSYAEKRQDKMAYDIRRRHEENLSPEEFALEVIRPVSPDTPLTLKAARYLMIKNNENEKKAQAEAKKLGYKIPMESTYKG